MSGLLVPARTTTLVAVLNPVEEIIIRVTVYQSHISILKGFWPSISTSSWFSVFSCSLWPPKFPPPLFLPTASISSMKRMQGAFFLAMENISLTFGETPAWKESREQKYHQNCSRPETHSGRADAHKHLQELRTIDGDEWNVGLSGCGFSKQGLTSSWRSRKHGTLIEEKSKGFCDDLSLKQVHCPIKIMQE